MQAMLATLSALAEPNRLRIVGLLRDGPRPVGEIVHRLRLQQPQVSKHLRILGDVGLVAMRPDAQRRIYALRLEPLQELDAWLESYRRLWEGNYARLDALLDEMKTSPTRSRKPARNPRKRGTR
jgi:DNA-binding transcriptional ArsR family regulator